MIIGLAGKAFEVLRLHSDETISTEASLNYEQQEQSDDDSQFEEALAAVEEL